ncbi:hypothetical protein D1159_03955 [Pseudoflavonifractor sp. 524-17]|uniref:type II toxin-antitoxin system PemK/MazF family toxin n=1 Tax=Pseudoflavonifractor sp. 524-17 TaxID=2304577 RepID=UPI00137B3B7F|nr:type II toxin-antitoxin system PemK/MazF family toxin [Pseudoflavonifractor sp. 524-17]NCE63752.1 hypothetical protein [Pseudoflavonifractor sp. 524-17]
MIGKIYLTRVDFYNSRTGRTEQKTRPVLSVGGPNEDDYTILPISTISRRENVNYYYDIPISEQARAALSLDRECFIRMHKQMTAHRGSLIREIGDMRSDVPDLYINAIEKMEEFQNNIVEFSI